MAGWPQIDLDLLGRWGMAGGNLVHVRLGPYWHISEGAQFDSYEHLGARADLSRFRVAYWQALSDLAQAAFSLGVYLEVDLIDGWVMKPANVTLSPWHPQNNVQNEIHVGCDHMQGSLDSRQEQWIRQAIRVLGPFPNVIWQISNESGLCGVSPNWEMDAAWIIRDEEQRRGFIAHMIGTNSELPEIESLSSIDYIMYHVNHAVPVRHSKPTGVNEYPNITPAEYARQLDTAHALGTRLDLWLGDSGEADLQQFLDVVRRHTGR